MRALEQEQDGYKARLSNFRGSKEDSGSNNGRRHGYSQSMVIESTSTDDLVEDTRATKSQSSRSDKSLPRPSIGSSLDKDQSSGPRSRLGTVGGDKDSVQKDMEMMKERFAKLLLGEDMSGGGKGVSSALALSNAITNLAASVFGEQRKLEPMATENRARWKKEIDWLTSVTDHIVEFAPSQQKSANGVCMEIMTTKQRSDIHMHIPVLRKLDTMLIDCLDNFKDQHEFYYVSKDPNESRKGKRDDKWWLPTVKVPPDGLSDVTRKWLHFQKDSVNQVLKAALAINAQILTEMEIPENYIDSLPKNGRASLGDTIYKSITVEYFDIDQFLYSMDLSSEHKILDLMNRIEASVVIWRRKMCSKDSKSPWGSGVSLEKRELFEERAETILLILRQRFPGVSQSSLDISKIQFNQDVGHALLESYSRILESLAHTILSRIEDVLYVDSLTQNPSLAQAKRNPLIDVKVTSMKFPNPEEEIEKLNAVGTPKSMTLFDFMGWAAENEDVENEENFEDGEPRQLGKPPSIVIPSKGSYLETLGGLRSPTSRH
ncbi:rop guanine nucleotide exchange factor 12 [Silene latifolia]|uniref:rop guanine nucleotide exchange factor 12 n=1 Tax=Silene latifolia TaxID=37657 RepID=UPI003D77BAEC